jgi:hypothetical protein
MHGIRSIGNAKGPQSAQRSGQNGVVDAFSSKELYGTIDHGVRECRDTHFDARNETSR